MKERLVAMALMGMAGLLAVIDMVGVVQSARAWAPSQADT